MRQIVRRLAPGLGAIVLTSAVLLVSDLRSRQAPRSPLPRIALLQHASQQGIDQAYGGVVAALEENGFPVGRGVTLQRFNPEGDQATANAMADEIVGGRFDLAITLTTPSLQALARANRQGKVRHVFGLVTDPIAAGVGVEKDPLRHPPWLVGVGAMQPVAETIRLARRLNPSLKSLGVVWNPAEINSEINTRLCRDACRELGIALHEANAENTAAVREGASSLIARQVEALWVGGDVTVLAALDSLVIPARTAHVPVFTSIPGSVRQGTLFDLGGDYFAIGYSTGVLATKVLSGTEPAKLPDEFTTYTTLNVNTLAARGLRDAWTLPPDLIESASLVIDESGAHEKERASSKQAKAASAAPGRLDRKWRVRILEYVNVTDAEEAEKGVLDGLRDAGLVAGRDFEHDVLNAQGDMATLSGLVDAALTARADLIVTLSTPTLQATLRKVKSVPVVFTFVADAVTAGAGRSDTDHLPNVTGTYASGDYQGMFELIPKVMPSARRIGLLYCPNEVNSSFNYDLCLKAARAARYETESIGVNTASEVADAALALCGKSIDLICLPTANLTASTFPSISQAAQRSKVPIFAFLGGLADQGASLCVARDYYDMGLDAGKLAARVMRGESPAGIPLQPATQSKLTLNPDAARHCGLLFSDELRKSAARIVGK